MWWLKRRDPVCGGWTNLHKYNPHWSGLCGRGARKLPGLWGRKKNTWRSLRLWETRFKTLCSDETKTEQSGLNSKCHVWGKPGTQRWNLLVAAASYCGAGGWGEAEPGEDRSELASDQTEGLPYGRTLTLNTWPRRSGLRTTLHVLEWFSQSPDLNLIEHLSRDL